MGCDNHVVQGEQGVVRRHRLHLRHIHSRAGDMAGHQSLIQGPLTDDTAPGAVDDIGPLAHTCQLPVGDHPPRLVVEGQVEGEEVASGEHLLLAAQGHVLLELLGQLLHIGVIGQHLHTEAPGPPGHVFGDGPKPHQAQSLAAHIHADGGLPLALVDPPVCADNIPGHRQHQAEGQIGHRIGVGPRDIAHRNPQLPGLVQVNVVQARPVLADDLQPGAALHHRLGKLVGADNQGIVVRNHGLKLCLVKVLPLQGDLIARLLQDIQRLVADFSEGTGGNQHLFIHGLLLSHQ